MTYVVIPTTGLATTQLCRLDELWRCDLGVGVLGDTLQLVPVEGAVEPDAEPATVPDVGRHEEPLGIALDQHLLHPLRSGAPHREAPVPVVVREHHQEGPFAPDEEGGRPVAEPLARLGQAEADRADPLQNLLAIDQRNQP
jgi:hypothetical protein